MAVEAVETEVVVVGMTVSSLAGLQWVSGVMEMAALPPRNQIPRRNPAFGAAADFPWTLPPTSTCSPPYSSISSMECDLVA